MFIYISKDIQKYFSFIYTSDLIMSLFEMFHVKYEKQKAISNQRKCQ